MSRGGNGRGSDARLRHRDGHVRRRAHGSHARLRGFGLLLRGQLAFEPASPSLVRVNESHRARGRPASSGRGLRLAQRRLLRRSGGRAFAPCERPASPTRRCSSMPPTTSSSPVTSRAAAGIRCAPTAPPSGQGIQRERLMLMGLRDRADYVIDTTDMLPQKLRSTIRGLFATGSERKGLAVTVYSFGFKHGAPYDADLVMDVRFLPNPYYDPELRPLTGLDAPVRDFVRMREETIEFEQKWHDLLDVVMPGYVAEGKQQLAIGVGCTGGQHRSVALAEATGDYLKSKGYRVSVAHRDLRWPSAVTTCSARATTCWTPVPAAERKRRRWPA